MAVGHQGIQCIFLISFTPVDRTRLRKPPRLMHSRCDSELTFDNRTYHKKHDYLVAFNWQSKFGRADTLDIEQLKSISIDKKSVYKQDCFKN
jgi:hypothetical protein